MESQHNVPGHDAKFAEDVTKVLDRFKCKADLHRFLVTSKVGVF